MTRTWTRSQAFDFSSNINDTPDGEMASLHQSFYQGTVEGHINLTQVPVEDRHWESTFEKGDKSRDMDEVKNMHVLLINGQPDDGARRHRQAQGESG